jgi:hypothetical protein
MANKTFHFSLTRQLSNHKKRQENSLNFLGQKKNTNNSKFIPKDAIKFYALFSLFISPQFHKRADQKKEH